MSISRRKLLGTAAAAAALAQAGRAEQKPSRTIAVSSSNGLKAVALAVQRMQEGADPLDAAIAGVNLVEDDPADMTVGYGGVPNEEGVVQLDASVMHGPTARAGAVAPIISKLNPRAKTVEKVAVGRLITDNSRGCVPKFSAVNERT